MRDAPWLVPSSVFDVSGARILSSGGSTMTLRDELRVGLARRPHRDCAGIRGKGEYDNLATGRIRD